MVVVPFLLFLLFLPPCKCLSKTPPAQSVINIKNSICKEGSQFSNLVLNDGGAFSSSYPVDLDPGHFCCHFGWFLNEVWQIHLAPNTAILYTLEKNGCSVRILCTCIKLLKCKPAWILVSVLLFFLLFLPFFHTFSKVNFGLFIHTNYSTLLICSKYVGNLYLLFIKSLQY